MPLTSSIGASEMVQGSMAENRAAIDKSSVEWNLAEGAAAKAAVSAVAAVAARSLDSESESDSELPPLNVELVLRWRQSLANPRMQRQLVQRLAKTAIFGQCTEALRMALCSVLVPVQYPAGATVFCQDEPGEWLGLVLSGKLDKERVSDGRKTKLGRVAPGETIGDLGVLGVCPKRYYTYVAGSPITMLVLSRHQLHQVAKSVEDTVILSELADGERMRGIMERLDNVFLEVPWLRTFSTDFVLSLRKQCDIGVRYSNEILVSEGALPTNMYILLHGTATTCQKNIHLGELSSGSVLCEHAVYPRNARHMYVKETVRMKSLGLVAVVKRSLVEDLVRFCPDAASIFDKTYVLDLLRFEKKAAHDELKELSSSIGSCMPRKFEDTLNMLGQYGWSSLALEAASERRSTCKKKMENFAEARKSAAHWTSQALQDAEAGDKNNERPTSASTRATVSPDLPASLFRGDSPATTRSATPSESFAVRLDPLAPRRPGSSPRQRASITGGTTPRANAGGRRWLSMVGSTPRSNGLRPVSAGSPRFSYGRRPSSPTAAATPKGFTRRSM
jgi:CRP-like cAMP-binding protein